ncbi:MFS transporter [Demequina globuliformis]|uniref:MFS transporter n=1 Tax=Demequina globuliformis TaxID=676202 RepID=UPI000783638C|nr:MFS transporter [Demequina globuliformis]
MLSRYREVLSLPGARAFAFWGLIARLQMGMTGLATFLLVQMEYGSYAAGGVMLAAISVSYVLIAPQVARLVDAHGQARVLRWGYAIAIAGRVGLLVAALNGAPLWVLVLIAPTFAAGGSQSTLTRARWSHAVKDDKQLATAFSFESSMEQLLWIGGPAVSTVLAVSVASWLPSVIAVISLAVGGYAFLALKATEPPVRRLSADAGLTEAALAVTPATAGAGAALPAVETSTVRRVRRYRNPFAGNLLLTTPTLAIAALIFLTQGAMFASIDAAVVAFTEALHVKEASGLILGVWSVGSLVGGLAYGVIGWRRSLATRLVLGVTATGTFAAMLAFAPSMFVLGGLLFGMGLFIAPNMVIGDSLVHQSVSRARMTEGMTWTRTGIDLGVAIGAWGAGVAIDAGGSQAGFAVTAVAGGVGVLTALAAWHYLRRPARRGTEAATVPAIQSFATVPAAGAPLPAEVSVEVPADASALDTRHYLVEPAGYISAEDVAEVRAMVDEAVTALAERDASATPQAQAVATEAALAVEAADSAVEAAAQVIQRAAATAPWADAAVASADVTEPGTEPAAQ